MQSLTDMTAALEEAIECHRVGKRLAPQAMHERVHQMYKWQDVAERTERVKESVDVLYMLA